MSMDDDADDDGDGIRPPLPPDDRLWRHPSELASSPALGLPSGAHARGLAWPTAVVAGLVGATLAGGLLYVTGTLSTRGQQRVIEKVAVTPVVSSPMVSGERGVEALTKQVGPAVVRLVVQTDAGTAAASGVVFRDDGMLLTSAHEVTGATAIAVILHDGRSFDGELVGVDLPTDVAVVSIDADDVSAAVLGTSADLEVGSSTAALGWAAVAAGELSVTTGVVSGTQRRVDIDGESLHGMIQTDAPIEPGWSGGPLVDASGAVIGITADVTGAGAAFGFATPIDLARRMADQLLASGRVAHAWLGIEGSDLSPADAEVMGVPGGAVVRRVAGNSPAARGGLVANDVITDIDDRSVSSSSALVVAMRHHQPGDQVVVGFWRAGHYAEATVTCAERL